MALPSSLYYDCTTNEARGSKRIIVVEINTHWLVSPTSLALWNHDIEPAASQAAEKLVQVLLYLLQTPRLCSWDEGSSSTRPFDFYLEAVKDKGAWRLWFICLDIWFCIDKGIESVLNKQGDCPVHLQSKEYYLDSILVPSLKDRETLSPNRNLVKRCKLSNPLNPASLYELFAPGQVISNSTLARGVQGNVNKYMGGDDNLVHFPRSVQRISSQASSLHLAKCHLIAVPLPPLPPPSPVSLLKGQTSSLSVTRLVKR